jgi:hypothetical protein
MAMPRDRQDVCPANRAKSGGLCGLAAKVAHNLTRVRQNV